MGRGMMGRGMMGREGMMERDKKRGRNRGGGIEGEE